MRRRAGFTLIEVMLAMVIAVMVLAAVYSFVGYQLKQAEAGREVIERTTLARSILGRIDTDVRATIALSDPGRFRTAPDTTGDTAVDPMAATTEPTDPSSMPPEAATMAPVVLPLGVIGSDTELSIYVSRVPGEIFGDGAAEAGSITSDLRRISYWLGGEGDKSGLCRREVRLITSELATTAELPTGDVDQYLYAAEVKSLKFSYFDGTGWQDSWDSTTVGPDQKTPIGSPRAIAVYIGVLPQGAGPALAGIEPELKVYRHVIQIPTANGTPLNRNPEGGTTAP